MSGLLVVLAAIAVVVAIGVLTGRYIAWSEHRVPKYRVVVREDALGTRTYEPQLKGLLSWEPLRLGDGWSASGRLRFHTYEEARDRIKSDVTARLRGKPRRVTIIDVNIGPGGGPR